MTAKNAIKLVVAFGVLAAVLIFLGVNFVPITRATTSGKENLAGAPSLIRSDWIERHPSNYFVNSDWSERHPLNYYANSDWIERHPSLVKVVNIYDNSDWIERHPSNYFANSDWIERHPTSTK